MLDTLCYSFEAQMFHDSEWMLSVGRWTTPEEAAIAAGKWLLVCAENAAFGSVRVKQIREWELT